MNSIGKNDAPSPFNIAGRKDGPSGIAEIAAEFVRLKVDIIVTFADAVPSLNQATSAIPIVFLLARNPVGLVAVRLEG